MPRIVNDITELIGDTPVVALSRMKERGAAEVLVKLERFNPSGSVKDRAASALIAAGEAQGRWCRERPSSSRPAETRASDLP